MPTLVLGQNTACPPMPQSWCHGMLARPFVRPGSLRITAEPSMRSGAHAVAGLGEGAEAL